MPSARRAARALLLRSTSALFLRDAHAPVVVQIAICESERMSTSSPGRTRSRALVSAWHTALSSPVLLVARVAPRCSAWFGLVITRPHSSLTAAPRSNSASVSACMLPSVVRTEVRPQPAWPPWPEPSVANTSRGRSGSVGRGLRQLARMSVQIRPPLTLARPVSTQPLWKSTYADSLLLQDLRSCCSN